MFSIDINGKYDNRVEVEGTTLNDGLLAGYYGTSEYLSILNGNIYDFYEKFVISSGIRGAKHRLGGLDGRNSLKQILGVDVEGNFPLGLWYNNAISEDYFETISAIDRQRIILDTVVIDSDVESKNINYGTVLEIPFTIEYEEMNVKDNYIEVSDHSSMILHLDTETILDKEGELYIEFQGLYPVSGNYSTISVNTKVLNVCNEKYIYHFGTNDYLFKLDDCDEIVICFNAKNIYEIGNIKVYWCDESQMESKLGVLRENSIKNVTCSNEQITGNIVAKESGWLFLSIPYNKNWKAYVDGRPVETVKADIGFTAVNIDTGEHSITMKYQPTWFGIGVVCTLCSIIVCIVLWRSEESCLE